MAAICPAAFDGMAARHRKLAACPRRASLGALKDGSRLERFASRLADRGGRRTRWAAAADPFGATLTGQLTKLSSEPERRGPGADWLLHRRAFNLEQRGYGGVGRRGRSAPISDGVRPCSGLWRKSLVVRMHRAKVNNRLLEDECAATRSISLPSRASSKKGGRGRPCELPPGNCGSGEEASGRRGCGPRMAGRLLDAPHRTMSVTGDGLGGLSPNGRHVGRGRAIARRLRTMGQAVLFWTGGVHGTSTEALARLCNPGQSRRAAGANAPLCGHLASRWDSISKVRARRRALDDRTGGLRRGLNDLTIRCGAFMGLWACRNLGASINASRFFCPKVCKLSLWKAGRSGRSG